MPEARARLERGDASFLRGVPADALPQAFRLGPGAPYYLSFWAEELGDRAQAQALLALQWERGGGRWKEEAALGLLADLAAREEWAEAERQARRFLPALRSLESRRRCERTLAEALYWQHKDGELLSRLGRLPPDDELTLFRAAASCRLAAPDWPDRFRELFFRLPASALHARALSFLQLEERLARFQPAEAAYFQAKAALAEGRTEEGLKGLEACLPGLSRERQAQAIPETAGVFLRAGQAARGARLIVPLAAGVDGAEWAGRLQRRAGQPAAAAEAFRGVLHESPDPDQRDRASWFLLDLARGRSDEDFLAELRGQSWSDPAYFLDILEEETSDLVARRQWALLSRLRAQLSGLSAPAAAPALARLCFLEGRLRAPGLLPGDALELYREAARLEPGGYYGRLGAALLPAGERPAFESPEGAQPLEEAENGGREAGERAADAPFSPAAGPAEAGITLEAEALPASASGPMPAEPEDFLLGFLEQGLYQEGYRRILAQDSKPAFLLRAARELNRRQQYLLSLRLLTRYLDALHTPPAEEVLRLYYPLGYQQQVEELCRQEGIPPAVFFALVREESHFDPLIVSSAGAVGLTQLLPETGLEVARMLRIEQPDLRDPAQNLRIGARHLARLAARLEDLTRALVAYNAGWGRLRGWDRSFELPTDLLVEAVPFPETRRYVRKILVSAVNYGCLYYGLSAADTVRLFYPHLGQAGPGEGRLTP